MGWISSKNGDYRPAAHPMRRTGAGRDTALPRGRWGSGAFRSVRISKALMHRRIFGGRVLAVGPGPV
jgi:hypothetical protein